MIAAAHSFSYVSSDIPEDMTLDAWRRRNILVASSAHAGRLGRLRRRAVGIARPVPAPRLRFA